MNTTDSEYVILIAFPLRRWLRERASVLRLYVHCLSSYVYVFSQLTNMSSFLSPFVVRSLILLLLHHHHHHHHYHHSFMELGHLLTRSGLTHPEVSLTVYHDFFCQLGNIVS